MDVTIASLKLRHQDINGPWQRIPACVERSKTQNPWPSNLHLQSIIVIRVSTKRLANVFPLHKKGAKDIPWKLPTCFHPSKILEHIVHSSVFQFLEENHQLSSRILKWYATGVCSQWLGTSLNPSMLHYLISPRPLIQFPIGDCTQSFNHMV
jgi:hypothetical protein